MLPIDISGVPLDVIKKINADTDSILSFASKPGGFVNMKFKNPISDMDTTFKFNEEFEYQILDLPIKMKVKSEQRLTAEY